MKPVSSLRALVLGQAAPVGAAGLASRDTAGTRRHPVQYRPEQVLIDDLVVGPHGGQPLSFNPCSLTDAAQPAHGGKIGALQ
jgi:hypothetical protein